MYITRMEHTVKWALSCLWKRGLVYLQLDRTRAHQTHPQIYYQVQKMILWCYFHVTSYMHLLTSQKNNKMHGISGSSHIAEMYSKLHRQVGTHCSPVTLAENRDCAYYERRRSSVDYVLWASWIIHGCKSWAAWMFRFSHGVMADWHWQKRAGSLFFCLEWCPV